MLFRYLPDSVGNVGWIPYGTPTDAKPFAGESPVSVPTTQPSVEPVLRSYTERRDIGEGTAIEFGSSGSGDLFMSAMVSRGY